MTTSADAQVHQYSHINGSSEDLLERFAVSELCKGWPVYRDASEWKNYRSLFCKEAMVWTSEQEPTTSSLSHLSVFNFYRSQITHTRHLITIIQTRNYT